MAGQSAGLDRVLWLAPSSRSVAAVRELLIARGLDACLSPGVMTFDNLADAHSARGQELGLRPIAPVLQRELLRRVIVRALEDGALKYFADAARRSGFVELLAEHIRELKRHDISPAAYEKISAARGQSPQHRELARLYRRLRTAADVAPAHRSRERALQRPANALAERRMSALPELDLIVADGFTDFTRTQLEILQLLAKRAKQLYISLPDDVPTQQLVRDPTSSPKPPPRSPSSSSIFPDLEAAAVARAAPRRGPTIDYVADIIFRHPKPAAVGRRARMRSIRSKSSKPPAPTTKSSNSPAASSKRLNRR